MKIQKKKIQTKCKVYYFDLFGKKKEKYNFLWNHDINNTNWQKLKPEKKFFFFAPKDFSFKKQYEKFWHLKSIFKLSNIGIASGKDDQFVKFNESEFSQSEQEFVKDYFYRPFDYRKILYNVKKLQRARLSIMKNVDKSNLILCVGKQIKNNYPQLSITKALTCRHTITDMTYIFPLYIISNGEEKIFIGVKEPEIEYFAGEKNKKKYTKRDNFTKEFRLFIKNKYKSEYSPEDILGYIYAILHSPTYRTRYIEFLKIDFPRIPFTDDEKQFKKLSKIGWELIQHHLLEKTNSGNRCRINGKGNNFKVEKVEYDKGKVWINNYRYFEFIPLPIWEFYIGGYQVLSKWLKERMKHEIILSSDDIQHFIDVVGVLEYSIKTMKKINKLTTDWI